MTRGRTKTYQINRQYIFVSLLSAISILIISYVLFLNMTLIHGVNVKASQEKLSELNQKSISLEQEYFKSKKGLSLSYAKTLGFEENTPSKYISRRGKETAFLPR